jgi:acid phosphatase
MKDVKQAANNTDLEWLASQGITLSNYWAITHPSQPNYCAVVGGDTFGLDSDDFFQIPANISTVVDLLDSKGISWSEYEENIPYAGFAGMNFSIQDTFQDAYVRKHNPLIMFDSVTSNATRLGLIKDLKSFEGDILNKTLPQWSFITPNMSNDGHDTNTTTAATWSRTFIEPLLTNDYFMNDTLVVLTWDENEQYTEENKVFAILLGGAIPPAFKNTTDNTFYNHYSLLSTVEANWGLPSLGRWDCGANVLELVASKAGYNNYAVDTSKLLFNTSYPGPLSNKKFVPDWPLPDTKANCGSRQGVLDSIVTEWGKSDGTYNYTDAYPYDDLSEDNAGGEAKPESTTMVSPSATAGTAAPTATKKSDGAESTFEGGSAAALMAGFVFVMAMV